MSKNIKKNKVTKKKIEKALIQSAQTRSDKDLIKAALSSGKLEIMVVGGDS